MFRLWLVHPGDCSIVFELSVYGINFITSRNRFGDLKQTLSIRWNTRTPSKSNITVEAAAAMLSQSAGATNIGPYHLD